MPLAWRIRLPAPLRDDQELLDRLYALTRKAIDHRLWELGWHREGQTWVRDAPAAKARRKGGGR